MALDISGFLVPEQKYEGLYKIGDALAAKEAAKVKAKAAAASKVFKPYEFADIETKTIEDANLNMGLAEINDLGMKVIASGGSDADAMQQTAPLWNKLKTSSLNIKERGRQIDNILLNNKTIPGIDADKLTKATQMAAWYDENGKFIEDYSTIDPTVDIQSKILQNGDIYNVGQAVQADVNKRPKQTQGTDVLRRDAKGGIYGAKVNVQTAAGFVPKYEKDAKTNKDVFVGVEPVHIVAPDNDATKVVKDYLGISQTAPLKLMDDGEFNNIRGSFSPIKNAVDQETKKFTEKVFAGKNPTQDEINQAAAAFQKARYYQLYDDAGKGFVHQDAEKKEQPVIKNSTTIINKGAGSGEETRNIHTPNADIYVKKQKDLGKIDVYMPMNETSSDFTATIVKAVNDNESDKTKYDMNNLAVKLINQGGDEAWEVYETKKDGTIIRLKTTVPATSLNWTYQPGAKEKRRLAKEEKEKQKKGKKKFD
jgi:hypothetical protein